MAKGKLSFPNFNLKTKPGNAQRVVNFITDQDSYDIIQTFAHERMDEFPTLGHMIARALEKELGLEGDTLSPKTNEKRY